MSQGSLGNSLNQLLTSAIYALFSLGELMQLTFTAYDHMIVKIRSENLESYDLKYPIGYKAGRTPMLGSRTYKKEELVGRYSVLANNQLALNGIYHLVTIVEAVLGDLLRKAIAKYPQKIGSKRSIPSSRILSCSSIEEIQMKTIDSILNELSYKSPRDFAQECHSFLSVNMLECPAFHKYIEIKATRDTYIHNLGIANDLYLSKTDSHARVSKGDRLPVDTAYFLESYEVSIQLMEWLEKELHDIWPSSELEERRAKKNAEQDNADDI